MQIKISNLNKVYKKNKKKIHVIKDFSVDFSSGKIYLLKGDSGKGKTTLLTMISLLQQPDSGEIFFDGINMCKENSSRRCEVRKNNIGIVFQDFSLFQSLSVIDNITLVDQCIYPKDKKMIIERARELLVKFRLEERESHLPSELSGGEQQRVGLIRAILNEPEILVCDEPVSNLDAENAKRIVDYIVEYCHSKNKIVIVTSHDKSFDDCADEIIFL